MLDILGGFLILGLVSVWAVYDFQRRPGTLQKTRPVLIAGMLWVVIVINMLD
jgi:hypothetical protein